MSANVARCGTSNLQTSTRFGRRALDTSHDAELPIAAAYSLPPRQRINIPGQRMKMHATNALLSA
jgi:hypothetical protein